MNFLALRKISGIKSAYVHDSRIGMTAPIRSRLRTVLSRDLLIDLEDRIKAEALRAHEVVRDGFEGLTPLRARGLEGQARFRSCEQGFEDVCSLHGGISSRAG
ncbi:hypothetical protein [Bradyrhizobium sp. RDI18]|uniref:hypothetical protein n=1 Tax=Bradyrhizobium sp. RDI18 TaxID=3367400 RepID=UPI0037210F11